MLRSLNSGPSVFLVFCYNIVKRGPFATKFCTRSAIDNVNKCCKFGYCGKIFGKCLRKVLKIWPLSACLCISLFVPLSACVLMFVCCYHLDSTPVTTSWRPIWKWLVSTWRMKTQSRRRLISIERHCCKPSPHAKICRYITRQVQCWKCTLLAQHRLNTVYSRILCLRKIAKSSPVLSHFVVQHNADIKCINLIFIDSLCRKRKMASFYCCGTFWTQRSVILTYFNLMRDLL